MSGNTPSSPKATGQRRTILQGENESRTELFKTVATFGFLSAAMFCLGAPALLVFGPGFGDCFRQTVIVFSGIAAFLIVVCVLVFYYLLHRYEKWERVNEGEQAQG